MGLSVQQALRPRPEETRELGPQHFATAFGNHRGREDRHQARTVGQGLLPPALLTPVHEVADRRGHSGSGSQLRGRRLHLGEQKVQVLRPEGVGVGE
ncbi:hypothetical protein GCM10010286_23060 [Streptomyces toxytricini]|nr:hypothetical protein GCM10010286_23060 [Streptomyces toxytricini]